MIIQSKKIWIADQFIAAQVTGPNGVDDQVEMGRHYPLMNGYWRNKIPDFSKVRIPVYQTAGWSHFHLRGSVNAWRRCKSRKKWLRAHRDFEWPDSYSPENLEDLKRFYDRYLKDIHNGWEMTPKVRIDVMDAFDVDYQVRRGEDNFPLKRTEYRRYYLDAAHMDMHEQEVPVHSTISYDGETGFVEFDMEFTEDTELTGYMFLRLFVEAEGNDDADLFINIQKADAAGNWVPWDTLGEHHPGAWGKCRVSHRELDEKLSTAYNPVMKHERELKLAPGEIAQCDIEIVPSGTRVSASASRSPATTSVTVGSSPSLGIPRTRVSTSSTPVVSTPASCRCPIFPPAIRPWATTIAKS